MKIKTNFGRTLFMRLSHRFQQADTINGYHFLLSTLINEGALQEDLITSNIRKIKSALDECNYIIDRYQTEEKFTINPDTNRQMLADYKVLIYPTKAFQMEQYRLNVHSKNIQEHKISALGRAVIKPMADKYTGKHYFGSYVKDKAQYDDATGNDGKQ